MCKSKEAQRNRRTSSGQSKSLRSLNILHLRIFEVGAICMEENAGRPKQGIYCFVEFSPVDTLFKRGNSQLI